MRADLAEAVESARTVATRGGSVTKPVARHSATTVKAILLSVARDLPPDMSMADLVEELDG